MLYLPHDHYVGRSLDLYGEYSEFEAQIFGQVLGAGQTVVEVGANIGAHTIYLAKLVGSAGTALAFEPQRPMFLLLCANLALNEQFHARAYHAAMGSASGSIRVPVLDVRAAQNFGALSLGSAERGDEVPVVPLDSLALSALHLLKIDVEGMEHEVLRGAAETIARHRPTLYVENDRRDRSGRLITTIEEFGYDAYWHLPPLYNPDNFFGAGDNVFANVVSINLLCLPREKAITVEGMRKVGGPDDWWQGSG